MSKKHVLFRLLNSAVLLALLLSPLSAGSALSQAPAAPPIPPQATPLPEKAIRFAPPGAALPDAAPPVAPPAEPAPAEPLNIEMRQEPQAPQAPDACSAPAVIPFGQDLEITLGPDNNANNYAAQSVAPTPAWGGTAQVSYMGTITQSTSSCPTSPAPEQVLVYKDTNYSGGCAILAPGEYASSSRFGISNDSLSAVKLGSNVSVRLYRDSDFSGDTFDTASSISDLKNYNWSGTTTPVNDRTSSIKVWLKPRAYAAVAVPFGTDNTAIIFRTESGTGELAVETWGTGNQWGNMIRLGLSTDANPAVVSRTPENYSIVARSGNALKYMNGDAAGPSLVWQDIPGGYDQDLQQTEAITNAVGNPSVVSTSPYQMMVFYRTSGGIIKFNEWQSGYGWRTYPVSLGKPTGTALSVDPVAVARDENHIAVFVVVDNKLYVKEWSNAKKSDWSDTTWTALSSTSSFSAKAVPPAVASRHSTNVSVGILSTASEIWFLQWTASATSEGWSTPTKLSGGLSSLGLTAASADEMVLYGVNSSGNFYTRKWTRANQWDASWSAGEAGWATAPAPSGVSLRVHELVIFGRNSSNNRLQAKEYTAAGRPPTVSTLTSSAYGTPRSQAVATFNARTYWVSAYRSSTDGKWYLAAKSTTTWTGYTIQMSNHPNADTASNKVSVAVADMNRDGNDEIAVTTLNTDGSLGQVSVFKLVVDSAGAVTNLTSLATTTFSLSGSTFKDINVAVGNLANTTTLLDTPDEILVAAIRSGYNQARVAAYRFSGSSLTALASQTVDALYPLDDLELAIAQLNNQAIERIVLGTYKVIYPFGRAFVSQYRLSGASFALEYTTNYHSLSYSLSGTYLSAMASGDINSDGLEEVAYSFGDQIMVYPDGISMRIPPSPSPNHSIAVGDINMDGLAEIVSYSQPYLAIARASHLGASQGLYEVNLIPATGVPLLADVDGDSLVATYKACAEFGEAQIITVANSQPQYYQSTAPYSTYQLNEGGLFSTETNSAGKEVGWETSLGGSISLEFEQELSFIVKLGKVSSKIEFEFAGKVGKGTTTEDSESTLTGGNYLGSNIRGVVCYVKTNYTCYTYDVARPGSTSTSTMMACSTRSPGGTAPQACDPINDWYSQSTRNTYGDSWAPVGHRTLVNGVMANTLDLNIPGNYAIPVNGVRTRPPVDPYLLWWDGWDNRVDVGSTEVPGEGSTPWEIQRESAIGSTTTCGFETKLTQSSGLGAFGFTVERSLSVGYAHEWNSSVTWSNGLGFSGEVYDYDQACGASCTPYTVAPFVYRAQAVTNAGVRYPYLEQDYYLTSYGSLNRALGAAPARALSAPSVTPQAPVVTSTTHLDPNTWYTGTTVAFTWGQPAGDPAVLRGYSWAFNTTPVFTPTAPSILTTTHTYLQVPDGIYYLHIQADAGGLKVSPVTHRQVKVDSHAPQVTFAADPSLPTGFGGWYNTPVAVSVAATDSVGSGVAGVEYSTDGAIWQPYSAPINIAADTPGDTLWARAADNVGYTSEPVSTTIKLDKTWPTTVDSDGYGLSYASIITDEVGNAQLVLGGALSDTLSGRLQVEVKAGDTGAWHTVSAVGDLPVPPGNEFPTTMTSLQWIYTPTFDVRGVYSLWARGVDAAGNYEPDWVHGAFWWEPDDVPELIESQVSVAPRQAYAGDVMAFTVGARNSGYQEALLLVTNTVPAGLTVVPESISDGGQYNASTRVITWTLDALWPGQTRYLFFKASADSTTTARTLENRLDLMAYWPWEPWPGVPPEPARYYYSATTTLAVLPGAGQAGASAPRVLNVAVVEGDLVSEPEVTLLVNATSDARFLYVKEWVWNIDLNRWELVAESDWVPFQAGTGFEMTQDASGKYGRYTWTLSEGDGVKYLGVWVADANGQVSNINEGNLFYANLLSISGQQLAAGQRVQYRLSLHANDLAIFNLVNLSGDADVYVWKPRAGFMPHYYSNGVSSGSLLLDSIAFFAPEEGMYVIEVQAVTDAYYRLVTAGALSGAGLLAETRVNPALVSLTEDDMALLKAQDEALLKAQDEMMRDAHQALASLSSTHLALAEKDRPAHPLSLSTPYTRYDVETLPTVQVSTRYRVYLPLVTK